MALYRVPEILHGDFLGDFLGDVLLGDFLLGDFFRGEVILMIFFFGVVFNAGIYFFIRNFFWKCRVVVGGCIDYNEDKKKTKVF